MGVRRTGAAISRRALNGQPAPSSQEGHAVAGTRRGLNCLSLQGPDWVPLFLGDLLLRQTGLVQRLIGLAADQQAVEQNRQLARHRHYRSLLAALAPHLA